MKNIVYCLILLNIFFIWSCKEEITFLEPPTQEINPNKPNANSLIISQNISGDSSKGSSIYQIIDAGDGGFLLTGVLNSYNIVGKFNQSGGTIWTRRTFFRARDILRIPENTGHISNALLAVGGYDSDADGDTDGNILLCNGAEGTLISELILDYDNYDVWLNTLVISSSSTDSCQYIGFGTAEVLGVYYPWAVRFTIDSTGVIFKREDTLYSSFPWIILDAACKNDDPSQTAYFLSGQRYLNDSTETNITLFGLSDSLNVIWNQDIIHRSGFTTSTYVGRGLITYGANLFVVGYTEFEKENNLSSGEWDAGLIASITKQGQINWIKAFQITEYSERYTDCCTDGNFLWVTGDCSSFMFTESKGIFSNALLSKVSLTADTVFSHMSFGNENYKSGLNSIVVRGTHAYCAGYTNQQISDGGYQSWFTEIDISNTTFLLKEKIGIEKVLSKGSYYIINDKPNKER
jgi:hypothetical protein